MPQYQMLFLHPGFQFSSYVLTRDPQERLMSNKPLNQTTPCELVGDFISSHSGTPRDPIQPHSMSGRNAIQCLLALSHQWRRYFSSLKCFQSRLDVHLKLHVIFQGYIYPIRSVVTMHCNGNHKSHTEHVIKSLYQDYTQFQLNTTLCTATYQQKMTKRSYRIVQIVVHHVQHTLHNS